MILHITAALATDRYDVLDNAASYVLHSWTSTAANQTASCSSDYESDYGPGEHMGLPYDWGGYVTLEEFDEQIEAGYGAGSHSWHGSLSCTTGVDCSGFVSMIWETGHYSTSTFYAVTHEIEHSELQPADALNDAGSHIVLLAYETHAGTPVFYEASGSASRTRVNSHSSWSYLDGYEPIRFDDIEGNWGEGDFKEGTQEQPIEITAFPYEDLRWTAGAMSDVFNTYACATDIDESGPEVIYHFQAAEAGTLSVVVTDDDTDGEEGDIDIHILTTLSEAGCVARAHTDLETTVGPGDIWIVMDTWVGSHEFPGPYWMRASFTGALGEPPSNESIEEELLETDADSDQSSKSLLPGSPAALNAIGCTYGPGPSLWLLALAGYVCNRSRMKHVQQ
jgi:hypothetical protein